MPDLPHPVKLRPRYVPKPWGGRRMERLLGHELPGEGPIGECWLVHDRDGDSSIIVGGPLDGVRIAELRGADPFPLLVKLLDANQPLSVQVHPDAEAAGELGGEPKTECWFVLDAAPGARVYRGLRDGCTPEEFRRALEADSVAECLHAVDVVPGDTIYVPAGTVHTIGAGVLLAEVQQNSDTTYRVHDWGRIGLDGEPRRLHVDAALRSIRFGPRSEDKIPQQQIVDDGTIGRILLVKSAHFTAEHVSAMGTFTLEVPESPDGTWRVLHVLSGEGELRPFERGVEPVAFGIGDTLLLPARHDAFEVSLGASVLRAMLFSR